MFKVVLLLLLLLLFLLILFGLKHVADYDHILATCCTGYIILIILSVVLMSYGCSFTNHFGC